MIFPFETSVSLPICLLTHGGKMYSLFTSLSEIMFVDLISCLRSFPLCPVELQTILLTYILLLFRKLDQRLNTGQKCILCLIY